VRSLVSQFILFSAVGAVGTAAHFILLILLVQLLAVPPVPASMAGFVCGALVNYTLNYRITFRSSAPHISALPRFLAVAAAGFCLNTIIMALVTVWLHYLLAQAVATVCVLAWNFFCNRCWTFGRADQ
jgi:putative flippase GtrA